MSTISYECQGAKTKLFFMGLQEAHTKGGSLRLGRMRCFGTLPGGGARGWGWP
jgi:hypothetical protein